MSDYRLDVEVSSANALQTLQRLEERLNSLTQAGNRASESVSRTGGVSGSAASSFNRLAQNTSHAGEGMMRLDKSSNSLNSSIGILTKSLLSYEIAARAISASDTYLGMQNRLKLVTEGEEALQRAMEQTFAISQKSGAVWASTVQIYQRFLDVGNNLSMTQDDIARITETVSKAVAMSGATAESANAAIIQFSQGLASGVLRGQEFNSVAEQTPALMDAFARGLGKTRSELREMSKQGKLTTEVLIGALQNAEESTDALFGRMTLGVGATFNKLRNSTVQWVGEMNEASGATSVLVNGMNLLAENLDGAVFIAGTAALASLTKTIITSTTATVADIAAKNVARATTIAEIQAVVALTSATAQSSQAKVAALAASVAEAQASVASATSAKALAMAKSVLAVRETQLAAATAAGTVATTAQTTATNTLTAATSRLALAKQAALGLFGGGAGLIAMGVSAAAMYMLLRKNTDESAEAAQRHAKYIDLSTDAVIRFNSAQKDDAIQTLTSSLAVQNKELKTMASSYAAVVNDVASSLAKMGDHKGLQEVYDILRQVRAGTLDFSEATDMMNKKKLITAEQRTSLLDAEKRYQDVYARALEASTSLEKFGVQSKIAGSAATNAAMQSNSLAAAMDGTATATDRASAAMQKYNDTLRASVKENAYILERQKNTSLDQAKREAEYYTATGKTPSAQVIQDIKSELALKSQVKAIEDAQRQGIKDSNKAQRQAESERKRAQKEAERERESRLKDFQSFLDGARTETEAINAEMDTFNALWSEFGNASTRGGYDKVMAVFVEQLAEADVAMKDLLGTYTDYFRTQADEVDDFYLREQFLLKYNTKLNKEQRVQMQTELKAAWDNEIALISVKWELERLEASKAFMAEKSYLEELNRIRKKEIDLAPELTDDQKGIRKQIQQNSYETERNQIDQKALDDYINVMNQLRPPSAQEDLIKQMDERRAIVQEALLQGQIDHQTYYEALKTMDMDYYNSSLSLWTGLWGESLNGWTSFFRTVAGENSASYKAIFAIQKGFTIATAALNIQKAISDGWAQGSSIYEKAAAVATIITQTGNIMSEISSIGFKAGGFTGNIGKDTIAGYVHGNEFVMPAEQTAKYRSDLERMHNGSYESPNQGGGNTNNFVFNNYISMNGDGNVSSSSESIQAEATGEILNAAMKKFLIEQLQQGGILQKWAAGGRA